METILEIVRIKQVIEEREGIATTTIRSPEDLADVAIHYIGDEDREVLLVIGLNTINKINVVSRCHVGTVDSTIVHPREIFKVLFLHNCTSYVVAHQHPSQELRPSSEDIQITKKLHECGKLLGCELLDHLIVNSKNFFSFKEKGYLR
jgi:DNA repair protein RadC